MITNIKTNVVLLFIMLLGFSSCKKQELGHGCWLAWSDKNIDLGHDQISKYILLSKNRERVLAALDAREIQSLTTALALLSESKRSSNLATSCKAGELFKRLWSIIRGEQTAPADREAFIINTEAAVRTCKENNWILRID